MYLLNWEVQGGNKKGLSRQVYRSQFLKDVNISIWVLIFSFRTL